jgi:hypothetical protein
LQHVPKLPGIRSSCDFERSSGSTVGFDQPGSSASLDRFREGNAASVEAGGWPRYLHCSFDCCGSIVLPQQRCEFRIGDGYYRWRSSIYDGNTHHLLAKLFGRKRKTGIRSISRFRLGQFVSHKFKGPQPKLEAFGLLCSRYLLVHAVHASAVPAACRSCFLASTSQFNFKLTTTHFDNIE